MDALDFAIYRHLSPDGLCRFWASRRVLDPRVTAREIAEKVGLSEAGVRARMRALREHGLLRASRVCLNPSLFGASLLVAELPVRDAQEAERVFSELALVDGVTFARDLLDEEDRKVRVYFAAESAAATARRTLVLKRVGATGALRGPSPYWIPESARTPSPLDWRLLAAFRRRPDAGLSDYAAEARVSLKTTAKRWHALLDARACWWTHSDDSDEWPYALLTVATRAGTDPTSVADRLAHRADGWIPAAPDGLGAPPDAHGRPVAGLVPVQSPTALERTVREVLSFDGVERVVRTFGLGSKSYPHWFDERTIDFATSGR